MFVASCSRREDPLPVRTDCSARYVEYIADWTFRRFVSGTVYLFFSPSITLQRFESPARWTRDATPFREILPEAGIRFFFLGIHRGCATACFARFHCRVETEKKNRVKRSEPQTRLFRKISVISVSGSLYVRKTGLFVPKVGFFARLSCWYSWVDGFRMVNFCRISDIVVSS